MPGGSGSKPSIRKRLVSTFAPLDLVLDQLFPSGLDKPGPSRKRLLSKLPPWPRDQRLRDIFPPGFDSNLRSSASAFHSPYSFPPEQLYRLFTDNYNHNKHVEHTIVKNAWYCKQEKSVKHEFILIEVEDTLMPNPTNFIILDRNKGERRQSSWPTSFLPSVLRTGAKDEFRVSYDGNVKRLLHDCKLESHEYLEQIMFDPDHPLPLYELVTLAHHVSEQHPRYNAMDANCYWFAGIIWECLIKMRPSAQHINPSPNKRGQFVWIRYRHNPIQVKNVCREVRGLISDFKSSLPGPEYVSIGDSPSCMNPLT
ncbi:hypothetical protein CTheo_7195 [Ceratobasidium theobromae]|uniref:Uncharacterized protein n=1 Tax=Ceratobasidium theobromae TaxID=1582974 RepID=A0A5N5QDE7_9AGAM|nr:hypothetical protein CTheo_7195 [Ceratobasidium theobromae]